MFVVSLRLCTIYTNGFGQNPKDQEINDLWVTRIQAETDTRVLITLWVEKGEIRVGEDLPILMTIKNNGNKPTYFMNEVPEITKVPSDVLIASPVPSSEDKREYDYSFHRIRPGEEYSGQFKIPHNLFQKEYELNVRTGPGFVEDISGLDRKLKYGDDPVALRGPLAHRMEVVMI